ncbi:hypothetical protein [Streptomyces sp. NPDC060002]|uniref:hypothetical protein n=1 Tax=Streptomyces sp. NPDC060002 TaxID=3347033 RepID=UPI0036B9A037
MPITLRPMPGCGRARRACPKRLATSSEAGGTDRGDRGRSARVAPEAVLRAGRTADTAATAGHPVAVLIPKGETDG